MKRVHSQEKEQFKKLFKQENIDAFEDRFKILDVFLQTESHLTVRELVQLLDESGYTFTHDFVRDTLKLMCRFGFARKNRFYNGEARYEHRHLGHHHDHMICTKCKNIYEFEDEQLENMQAQIAAAYNFHMLQHKMEIYGICSKCLKDHIQPMPLIHAKQGERLEIKEFTGGASARMRLLSIGLRVGDKIDIITNINKGQMVVSVDYNRYVLGRGLAQKILVEPVRS
ncbi:MAG: transcriptional repressor [Desulfobacteraceae bacterium]|nr:transcriptional repressor [Desulfobacteraceae bacterium]MDH3572460.1 transcriptional repressor [Desulfobacteraceae bacterium]MDH3720231.1 transcriptional repressor [Desulfobacteraceae bacterium]MDH3835277.1 transcriptional repressor [Desulfobacteraceae bacterium]MDH3874296.1 transcriptional repressor [Desulfobacteraceae bacterium]